GNAYPAVNPTGTTVAITGNGITLGSGNTLAGFAISNAGAANTALSGGAAGTLRVREVAINTNGRALSIATSATVTNDATFTGFTSVTSTGGTNGVSLVGVTGTVALGSGALSGATGATLSVSGGSATITYNGNISQANNAAMVSLGGGH